MRIPRRSIRKALYAVLGLALFAVALPAFADDDPPDRVARLSYIRGDVSFQPSGDDDWAQASLNRPLGTGDKLYTDRDSRVEMEVGAATLRLDAGSSFDILNLNDSVAQTELTQGIMNLHVRRVFEGQSYEVDTPTLAFVVTQPGDYRVDIAPDGNSTMVTVFSGAGDVYGENNASYSVRAGQTYRFNDSALRDYEVVDIPRGDDFDNWVQSRNNRYEHAASRQYVSEDVIGYADLDDYGGWNDVPEYGHVWYPSNVSVGWAPYRDGHWAWVDPWGWTWVDNAAWGFAPFHYGRWVYASNRWGWCPGPVAVRPIYAPALVAFVGGAGWGVSVSTGGPVGWFPLGPRDVYVPWYHTSHNYFTNVNVRNTTVINNTYITNVYNNYSRGTAITNVNYAYRQNPAAVTAVSREAFVNARAVNAARVQVNANQLRNANVVSRVGIAPERASFTGANPRARAMPAAQTLDRRVIARTAPPPKPAPVNARIAEVQRNGGQPLATQQLRQIAAKAPANAQANNRGAPQRVQVVGQGGAKPQPLPARGPAANANARGNAQVGNDNKANQPPNRGGPATTPATNPNARTPAVPNREQAQGQGKGQTPQERTVQRGQNAGDNGKGNANNANGMPSSRFAPHAGQPPRTASDNAARTATNRTPPNATANPNVDKPRGNERATVQRGQNEPANPSGNAQQRRTTTPKDDDNAPQQHRTVSAPPQGASNNAQAQRYERQQQQVRSAQQQQAAHEQQAMRAQQQQQREYTPRKAPSQPQYQPRSEQPQVQHAPQQQVQRQVQPQQQQHQQPQPTQERRAPPPRDKKKDDDKDDGHNHR